MKKLYNDLNSICESKLFLIVFPLLAFFFVLFFSYTTSPLYMHEGMDSGVFKSMGLAILKGKIPYVDFFDHKGPVLYFINAFGQWLIPGRNGIFILQIIGESAVFILLYKIARLFVSGLWSLVSVLFTLLIYCGFYGEGNLCEEWILVFTLPVVFFSFSQLCNGCKSYNSLWGVVYGMCFGLAFYIRPTDAIATVGGSMTGLTIYLVCDKKYILCVKNVCWFIIGFIVVSVPIISYFYINNAIYDLFYGLIVFNSKYVGSVSKMFVYCLGHHKLPFILLCLTICILILLSLYRNILYAFVPNVLYCVVLIGGNGFAHYLISYIFFFLLFAVFVTQQKSKAVIALSLFVLYCSSYSNDINYLYSVRSGIKSVVEMNKKSYRKYMKDFYTECDKIFMMVPEECRDSIWNYNLMWHVKPYSSLFFHNNIVQCNMVPYFDMYTVDQYLNEKDNILYKNPLYILLTHEEDTIFNHKKLFNDGYVFISDNYDMIGMSDTTICSLELYRRRINDTVSESIYE